MPDQVLAEVLKQGFLGVLLIIVVVYFLREVRTIRAERDAVTGELRELEKSIRTEIIPTMTRMNDAALTSAQVVMETRAELRERNRT